MARKTKQDWLIAGCHILAETDATQLKIDIITKRLGVTKGSFYHHFKDYQDYKTSLLDYVIEAGTLNIIEIMDEEVTPEARFTRLIETTVGYPPNMEVSIRAWALQDAQVRAYQERIDQQRIDYVRDIFLEMGYDAKKAQMMAQMAYAVYVGSQQIIPSLNSEDVNGIFYEIGRLYQFGEEDGK